MKAILIACLMLAFAVPAFAQDPIVNPEGVIFFCPDHAADDDHEIDIVRVSYGSFALRHPNQERHGVPLRLDGRRVVYVGASVMDEFRIPGSAAAIAATEPEFRRNYGPFRSEIADDP